jgi:hypothetical protein
MRLKSVQSDHPGTDVMILKIFSPKKISENIGVFSKIVIITLVSEKKRQFFRRNLAKSQKIVIITSTPGFVRCFLGVPTFRYVIIYLPKKVSLPN